MRHVCLLLVLALTAVLPAIAQIDLAGEWAPRFHEDQPERIPGPEIGDYLGLPINDAARLRAETWDASLLTLPEYQCKPHPSDYAPRGPANMRIWKEVDTATQRTVAWRTHISWQAPERTIYMDGRARPPAYAAHTWQGFSTGKWEGDVLTVTTTHLKAGWIRRNGVPRSDRATVTEHFIRHGDHLTLVTVIDDPVYLTEPFIRSTDFVLDLRQQIDPYPCESVDEIVRKAGFIPHHLPGANPFLSEFLKSRTIPAGAERGGPETMYPEYKPTAGGKPSTHPGKLPAPSNPVSDSKLHAQPVQGGIYMLVGAGGNSTVQVGRDGIVVVDAKLAPQADDVVAAIRQISDKPIRLLINTGPDRDHTAGNAGLSKAGSTITGGNFASANAEWGATIVAHENVALRMSQASEPGVPSNTYFTERKDLFANGEAVRLMHAPKAHTDGDTIVFFRRSDVVSTGDVFTPDRYPMVDLAKGGSINGLIDALNAIIEITVPADKQEGGTMVIPGHGRLCDEADVVEYREMVTIVRDRVEDAIKKGMTLEQVKSAGLTRDYDPLYGPGEPFVETVYRSLHPSR